MTVHALGVLGGMGPLATVDFYHKLIEATPADGDAGHIPVIIDADPRIPDRSTALTGDDRAARLAVTGALAVRVERLRAVTCGPLVAPCMSATLFLRRLDPPGLLDWPRLAAGELARLGVDAVTIAGTDGTLRAGLLAELEAAGINARQPDVLTQRRVMAAIRAVKAGCAAELPEIAPPVLVACTDLSALNPAGALDVSRLAAEAIARRWAGELSQGV